MTLPNLTDKQNGLFETYFQTLASENEKYNLTTVCDEQGVWEKHFRDSLYALPLIKRNAKICDVGCGAGFPGIPLCIVRDDVTAVEIDGTGKKIEFCKLVVDKLNLKNVRCVHARAEEFCRASREKFDVVTARAVAPLATLLEYLAPLCAVGGIVVAFKTDAEELNTARNAARVLGLEILPTVEIDASYGKRCLFVFKKVRKTDAIYPRAGGAARKSPL